MTDDTPGPRRITPELIAALRAFAAAESAELYATQIAQAADLDLRTAIGIARRMHQWGAVTTRWSDPRNGARPVLLYQLTDAGRRLAQQLTTDHDPQHDGTC